MMAPVNISKMIITFKDGSKITVYSKDAAAPKDANKGEWELGDTMLMVNYGGKSFAVYPLHTINQITFERES